MRGARQGCPAGSGSIPRPYDGRMTRVVAPYGTWTSPVSPGLLVEQAVGLSQLTVAGNRVYWNELRPTDAGRQVIVSMASGTEPADVINAPFSARSQVHEYGGRCYAVGRDAVVFSNWVDQRLWAIKSGQPPQPLTPEPGSARAERFADPVITEDGRWVICVHEHHGPAGAVDNDLVAVRLESPEPDRPPRLLSQGHDFFAAPRLSPDGSRLAWITWDHPAMPWDQTELWVAGIDGDLDLGEPVRLADGPGVSVTQPRWSPAGTLHYVSDRTGWWNLYDETGSTLCPLDAEFGQPDWVFGNATYGFLPDDRLVAVWSRSGHQQVGLIAGGRAEPLELPPFSYLDELQPGEDGFFAIAASPRTPAAVVRLDLGGDVEVLRPSRQVPIDEAEISSPRAVAVPHR